MQQATEGSSSMNEVTALRSDITRLYNMYESVIASRDQRLEVDMVDNRIRVAHLEKRLTQLEGIVYTINTGMPNVMERLSELEKIAEDLKIKAGDACGAEVAKMREVFGRLREALIHMGDGL